MERQTPGPGQESVWDYPRPPRVEPTTRHVRVVIGGLVVAESDRPFKVMETSHPPVYYIPIDDVRLDLLERSGHHTICEFKGQASYYSFTGGGEVIHNVGWFYVSPLPGFEALRDAVAFYPQLADEITLDGQIVTAQPGRFYGGWVTDEVVGPFKGAPETMGW